MDDVAVFIRWLWQRALQIAAQSASRNVMFELRQI
jgi:hypothetical protein